MKRHFSPSGGLGGRAAGAPFSLYSEVAGMKWLPRSPSRGRVRDAKILCALTMKQERARNLERRSPKKWASPREKQNTKVHRFLALATFPRAHRARRSLRCHYNDSAFRLFAAHRVPSPNSLRLIRVQGLLFSRGGTFLEKASDVGNRGGNADEKRKR